MRSFFIRHLRRVPFLEGLLEARRDDFREGAIETCLNVIVSTISIWLAAYVIWLQLPDAGAEKLGYVDLALREIERGELFLVITSMVAPAAYVLWKNKSLTPPFPSRFISLIVCCFGGALALFGYIVARVARYPDHALISKASLVIFCVTSAVVFVVSVNSNYRRYRERAAPEAFRQSEEDFQAAFARHLHQEGK